MSGQLRELQSQVKVLRQLCGGMAVALALVTGWTIIAQNRVPDVVRAERLEILEADGQPAFILANSKRPGAQTVDGKLLGESFLADRQAPSLIMYDGHGDEVGGMLFGNQQLRGKNHASRHISLDAFGGDQVVVLKHDQLGESATSGMVVSDMAHWTWLQQLEALGVQLPTSANEMKAAIEALSPDKKKEFLKNSHRARRLFAGVHDNESMLVLRDGQGKVRLSLAVPEEGEPRIELWGKDGKAQNILSLLKKEAP